MSGSPRPHLARLNATPAQRERASRAMKRWWADKRLPKMTGSQRYLYRAIREVAGREEALRQVFGP